MGYEMSKPNLRAELEADLKLVSEGRKDKRSVLQHHILKYKTVFIESVRKAKKLVGFVFHYTYLYICWCLFLPHFWLHTSYTGWIVSTIRLDEALSPYLGAALEMTEAEQQDMEIPLPVRKCPNCGRDMVLKKKREGNR